jgi:hypothetical protein
VRLRSSIKRQWNSTPAVDGVMKNVVPPKTSLVLLMTQASTEMLSVHKRQAWWKVPDAKTKAKSPARSAFQYAADAGARWSFSQGPMAWNIAAGGDDGRCSHYRVWAKSVDDL